MKPRIIPILFAVLISLSVQAQNVQKQIKVLDNYIEEAIKVWTPPGLAVAVVKDGEIVFTKGYGTTSLENGIPVDEHTLFVCASTTKAFTAASLAMLVDDGKVNWDDKVIDHLPDFQLYDPYMTREITIRDLLTHRTGLGNTDYLWSWMTISGDSALYKMREVKPTYSLRSSFIYQNLMYLAAGKVIEAASGQSWESFLQDRIYKPLGMTESYPLHSMVLDKPNKAEAHFKVDDKIIRIDQVTADEIGPAGSMWASISDMAKWMQFLSNDAIINNDTLISPANFKELFKPQQIIPANQFYPTARLTKPNWMTYGLGWFQHDYRGNIVQFHTGSLDGMVAIAGLMPEEDVAVYVMGNLDHVELRHAIMYTVFDLFMDDKITTDWSADLKALYDGLTQDDKEETKRVSGTKPPADDISGIYQNAIYGKIEVTKDGKGFQFNLNNKVKGKLSHWHYDTYQITFEKTYYSKAMINIRLDSEANISYMETMGDKFNYISNNE